LTEAVSKNINPLIGFYSDMTAAIFEQNHARPIFARQVHVEKLDKASHFLLLFTSLPGGAKWLGSPSKEDPGD
jgi:hypothetical protein